MVWWVDGGGGGGVVLISFMCAEFIHTGSEIYTSAECCTASSAYTVGIYTYGTCCLFSMISLFSEPVGLYEGNH